MLRTRALHSSIAGFCAALIFTLILVIGNLRESPLYWKYLPYTKWIFQTLGFEQRWGMYGSDYREISYTRYIYTFADGTHRTVYPRYWKQKEFNPFRYVKTEDFQWFYSDWDPNRELVLKLMRYYCVNPEVKWHAPVSAIEFEYAKAPFPTLEDPSSIHHPARVNPSFNTVLRLRCSE